MFFFIKMIFKLNVLKALLLRNKIKHFKQKGEWKFTTHFMYNIAKFNLPTKKLFINRSIQSDI